MSKLTHAFTLLILILFATVSPASTSVSGGHGHALEKYNIKPRFSGTVTAASNPSSAMETHIVVDNEDLTGSTVATIGGATETIPNRILTAPSSGAQSEGNNNIPINGNGMGNDIHASPSASGFVFASASAASASPSRSATASSTPTGNAGSTVRLPPVGVVVPLIVAFL